MYEENEIDSAIRDITERNRFVRARSTRIWLETAYMELKEGNLTSDRKKEIKKAIREKISETKDWLSGEVKP